MWLRLNTTAVYKCVHMFDSLYQVRAGNLHIYICVWEWEWERRAWKSAFSLWLWIFLFLVPFKCLYVVATYLTIQNTFVRLKYTQTQRAETEFSLRIQTVCVFFLLFSFWYMGSCQPLGHIVMVNGVATATAPPAAHGIRVNSAVFVRHPCGGCACVLYIVSHRNSLLSIFLYIFATFQHTLSYTRITAFSAENVVEHCSCSNLFPFSFFPVDVLWFLL